MGRKDTRAWAMKAMCHQCMGYWLDGVRDCQVTACPLYLWNTRAKLEADMSWAEYNPARVGRVTWEESKRDLTPEEEEQARQRAKHMHAVKAAKTVVEDSNPEPTFDPMRNAPQTDNASMITPPESGEFTENFLDMEPEEREEEPPWM